jgi:hypothetical protein
MHKSRTPREIRSSEKVTNTNKNSALFLIVVHYFLTNMQETKLKGLSESRFGSMIFLLRMAGIPFRMKKISTIYAIYMVTVIICASTTYIGFFVDAYMHREDLGLTMTTVRLLLSISNVMWIFSYSRWVSTQFVIYVVPQMGRKRFQNMLQNS